LSIIVSSITVSSHLALDLDSRLIGHFGIVVSAMFRACALIQLSR
jgi:hypothetical protein